MKSQVGTVGASPAELLLTQLLHLRGVDSVVVVTGTAPRRIRRVQNCGGLPVGDE
jgi:hypothetical protein